jgi:hypothetical protein
MVLSGVTVDFNESCSGILVLFLGWYSCCCGRCYLSNSVHRAAAVFSPYIKFSLSNHTFDGLGVGTLFLNAGQTLILSQGGAVLEAQHHQLARGPIPSHPTSPHPTPPYPTPFNTILTHPIPSHHIPPHSILSPPTQSILSLAGVCWSVLECVGVMLE